MSGNSINCKEFVIALLIGYQVNLNSFILILAGWSGHLISGGPQFQPGEGGDIG